MVIHRFLEVNSEKSLQLCLEHLGCLYKFHGKLKSLPFREVG
jgi:hypothetical protein